MEDAAERHPSPVSITSYPEQIVILLLETIHISRRINHGFKHTPHIRIICSNTASSSPINSRALGSFHSAKCECADAQGVIDDPKM